MIQAPAQNFFGKGIPGMLGASGPANQAAETSSEDVVEKLKREVIALAQMQSQQASSEDIAQQTNTVEGLLLMTAALSVITEAQANQLLNELSDIIGSSSQHN